VSSPAQGGTPESWELCDHASSSGCRGERVPETTSCLCHLGDTERADYLDTLIQGKPVSLRGTYFTPELIRDLFYHLPIPKNKRQIQSLSLKYAEFADGVSFEKIRFIDYANFTGAKFLGKALFRDAQFDDFAVFQDVNFKGGAEFFKARFLKDATFDGSVFEGPTSFYYADFQEGFSASNVQFTTEVKFTHMSTVGTFRLTGDIHSEADFRFISTGSAVEINAQFEGPSAFNGSTFKGFTNFEGTKFYQKLDVSSAKFRDFTSFAEVQFGNDAHFQRTEFEGIANFRGARSAARVLMNSATFHDSAGFDGGTFGGYASFNNAKFLGDISCVDTAFKGGADFSRVEFSRNAILAPVLCSSSISFSRCSFALPVTMDIAASHINFSLTRWEKGATLRIRSAQIELTDSVISGPLSITNHRVPFKSSAGEQFQPKNAVEKSQLLSINGVDCTHLVLTALDLTECRFVGAINLERIKIEGSTTFDSTPAGWHRRHFRVTKWSHRRTITEEHYWRSLPTNNGPSSAGWKSGEADPSRYLTANSDHLASAYRSLRKALEDRGDAPGSADFYYGEMEMRRHSRSNPRGERAVLWFYWLLSGYGLRASRALSWLMVAMAATVLGLMLWGLPGRHADPTTSGTVSGGDTITLHTDPPELGLTTSYRSRLSQGRLEDAAPVVLNAVIFRTTDQDLTTAGTYIDMIARLLEPSLLTLAVFAVRGRVKR
jgi:uncharacterized protein YjbI with pentapeptide repeats